MQAPTFAFAKTDTLEPMRLNERTDKFEPTCMALSTLKALPNRKKLRTETEEPQCIKSITLMFNRDPNLLMPITLNPDPNRTYERTDTDEAMVAKWNIEICEPNRT
jgi:hypothetical protein